MALQDDLREALSPVVASLMDEFPSVVTITRRAETLGVGNRVSYDQLPILNGEGTRVLLQAPTSALVRRIFGRDASGEAVMLVEDTTPLVALDKVEVTAGPYAGMSFWVRQTTPAYMAGIISALLTTARPEPAP